MAQHDYLLDNALGLDFRADLNLALLAIGSSNSGTVAPTKTAPGMLWFDTLVAPGTLKMRNALDRDWLAVAVGAGFLPLTGGTVTGALAVAGIFHNFDFDGMRVNYAGSVAPANPAGGQLWYDTTTTAGALKIRDVGNTTWLDVVDLTSPDLNTEMIINSVAGNAQLNLIASGERRRILGNTAGARFDFYGPADQPTAYISDAGDLYLPALGDWVGSYLNTLQASLGYTPVKQSDANTIAIGADPPHLYINGADQGAIALGPDATFMSADGIGSYAYCSSSVAVSQNGLVAGANLSFYLTSQHPTGTWRNVGSSVPATLGYVIFQKVA
jgi:hypothetical protein